MESVEQSCAPSWKHMSGTMRHQLPLTGLLGPPPQLLVWCQVLGKEGRKQKQVVTDADGALYSCKLSRCCPRGN